MLAVKKTEDTQSTQSHDSLVAPELLAHALPAPSVASMLGVDPNKGLDLDEVEERRAKYGANALQTIRPVSAWRILLNQFGSLIVALLAVAAIVAWVTSSHVEAFAIIVVLVLNAIVGFVTEWKAGQALDALRRQSRTTARVERGGYQSSIDAEELVPGDVIILNPGDRVPADARLIRSASLLADESVLTGESLTVDKSSEPVAPDALLAERHSMLYLGTTITAGTAVAIVTATGVNTELGRIGKLVASAPDERTPLEIKLNELGRKLIYVALAIASLVMITGWLRGDGFWMMIEVGISLAVAAVPEGLPAVTTLILALGVLRMARQRAIVRRLPAVETLGSTSVICADKTGTLTQNRLTVREWRLSDGKLIDLCDDNFETQEDDLLNHALRVTVLCNEASLNDDACAVGDPTETALLMAAVKLGTDIHRARAEYPKLDEVPFDSSSKRMITTHQGPARSRIIVLKGAPAVVLEASKKYVGRNACVRPLDDEKRAELMAINNEMAGRALRVLALAEKWVGKDSTDSDIDNGYTFLGFVGMIDPPRQGVLEAIEKAHTAGIRQVMLTGDQINTARAIARELGLADEEEPLAVHARDLEGMNGAELAALVRKVDVFARVSPADKLRIVEALKQAGEIVAVTGDGINDAPALKHANVGIAMGERGTEAAKEAADVVLTDDNFATLIKAIEGGRAIYANIIKFVHMMFSHNLGEVIVIFAAIAAGWPLPLLPLQILWMNLVTDVFPALALAVEPPSPGIMKRPPREPHSVLLSNRFLMLIGWQGAMLAAITLSIYAWAIKTYGEGAHARTLTLMTMVSVQLGHMFNCRSRTHSAFEGLLRNPFIWVAAAIVIILQMLAIYLKPLARVLDTVELTGTDWLLAGIAVLAPIAVVEITKLISRKAA